MNVLALDLGTSSVRGLVLDGAGVPVPGALVRRHTVLTVAEDGTATLDPHTYLAQLVECLDELASAGHLDGVRQVAVAAQWHSVLAVDATGAPLSPVLTWLDTRPRPLPGAGGPDDPDEFHQRTGTWWHRQYWTIRLPWLRRQVSGDLAGFTDLSGFIYGALLEDRAMSVSLASGTGLLDLRSGQWDAEACGIAGVELRELPPLAPAGWHGRLRAEYARRWPALRDARWAPATGDGAAATVGARCGDGARAAVTVGTSAAVRLAQDVPVGAPLPPLPHKLWRYRVDHDRIVTGTAYSGGGNLFAWAKRELRLPTGDELEAALARIPPGSGVRLDPRLGGDRPPGLAPAGSGQLSGLGFNTTAVEILAGLMYGLCRQVAEDLLQIEATVGRCVDVVLGGGAVAASRWWQQAFAVALAPRRIFRISHPEVGAIGAALLAAGQGEWCPAFERVSPPAADE